MWDETTDPAIDTPIERVAGELTGGEPDVSVKVRVLARIEAGAPSRSPRRFLWATPVAIAALLLFAFALWRRPEVVRAPEVPTVATLSTTPQQPAATPSEQNAEP